MGGDRRIGHKAYRYRGYGIECQCMKCEPARLADLYLPDYESHFMSIKCADELDLNYYIFTEVKVGSIRTT